METAIGCMSSCHLRGGEGGAARPGRQLHSSFSGVHCLRSKGPLALRPRRALDSSPTRCCQCSRQRSRVAYLLALPPRGTTLKRCVPRRGHTRWLVLLLTVIGLEQARVEATDSLPAAWASWYQTDVHVVTFSDYNNSWTEDMLVSATQNGYTVEYYSFKRPQFSFYDSANTTKDLACRLPPKAILLAVDAFDTIFMASAAQLSQRLATIAQGRDDFTLFAAERACWPDADKANKYPDLGSPYQFLNSGAFAGNAGHICSLLQKHLTDDMLRGDFLDQRFWTDLYLSPDNKGSIGLDTSATIFQTMFNSSADLSLVRHETLAGHKRAFVYNTVTHSTPLVFQANSGNKPENLALLGRMRKAMQSHLY